MFKTFSIQFHDRNTFNLALSILEKSDLNNFFHDIGHSDMIIKFDDKNVFDSFVSDLSVCQIWDKPSFKGAADFIIKQ
jgi:hypothetical protein